MKKILFFLGFIVFINHLNFSQNSYNLSSKKLNGNVKYFEEQSYNTILVNGEYLKGTRRSFWIKDEIVWFDEKGKYSKLQKINSDGTIFEEQIFIYNENEKLIKIEKRQNEEIIGNIIFLYNSIGLLTEEKELDKSSKIINKTVYSYNNAGFITNSTTYEDNEKYRIVNNIYNNQNILITSIEEFPEEEESYTYNYEYNDKNLVSLTNIFDFKGNLIKKISYQYNDNQLITEQNEYDSFGKIENKIINLYDSEFILIKQTIERGAFKTVTYLYEYDQNSNVIKTLEYKGDELIYIYNYNIEYY